MRNERTVEEIVKERSLNEFHQRCRQHQIPKEFLQYLRK